MRELDPLIVAGGVIEVEPEAASFPQVDPSLAEAADAQLGPLEIEQGRDRAAGSAFQTADGCQALAVLFDRAVAEVEPEHVGAGDEEVPDRLLCGARGPEGGDDLGVAVAAHAGSGTGAEAQLACSRSRAGSRRHLRWYIINSVDINGEFRIPASRERVWEALNDPGVLEECIPGCESIERQSESEFLAVIRSRIGPVNARFDSRIELSNLDPPVSYTISGSGKGGAAGFGRGSADVCLEADGDDTVLRYRAELQVGGKLAQIGSRLVAGATRKIASDFFSRFASALSGAGDRVETA